MNTEAENKTNEYLKGIVANLPEKPGIYQYLNAEGTIKMCIRDRFTPVCFFTASKPVSIETLCSFKVTVLSCDGKAHALNVQHIATRKHSSHRSVSYTHLCRYDKMKYGTSVFI